jgi:hypothetical protein
MNHTIKTLRKLCEDECAGAMVYDFLDAMELELRQLKKKRYRLVTHANVANGIIDEVLGEGGKEEA